MTLKARIRGKYATALTKFILDIGGTVVQASDVIASRFNIGRIGEPPDITIKDSEHVPGAITLIGKCDIVNFVIEMLLPVLDYDAVVWKSVIPLHRVVIGVVKAIGDKGPIVDLGGGVEAELKVAGESYNVGDVIPVYVVKTKVLPKDKVEVYPGVRVDTEYVSIFPGSGTVMFSRHIRDNARKALLEIGLRRIYEIPGYSIKWRSSAQYLDKEDAERELKRAIELLREIEEKSRSGEAYAVLQEGECIAEVIPGGKARLNLDNMRNTVMPTLAGHHAYKALKRNTAFLDFIEALLGKCNDRLGFSLEFFRQLMQRKWKVGIVHIRPTGELIRLGVANVLKLEPEEIVLQRRLRGGGVLDGLGISKEEGDMAFTCTSLWREYLVHVYTNRNLELKGVYININSPVEFTGSNIMYLDLAIDVVWSPNEGTKVIDVEELEGLVKGGVMPRQLAERAYGLAEELRRRAEDLGRECYEKALGLLSRSG